MATAMSTSGSERARRHDGSNDWLYFVFEDSLWKYEKRKLTPGEARNKQGLWEFYQTLDYAARKKVRCPITADGWFDSARNAIPAPHCASSHAHLPAVDQNAVAAASVHRFPNPVPLPLRRRCSTVSAGAVQIFTITDKTWAEFLMSLLRQAHGSKAGCALCSSRCSGGWRVRLGACRVPCTLATV
jgi:hypothetical protein